MRDTMTNRGQRPKIRSNIIAKGYLHKMSYLAYFQVGGNVVFGRWFMAWLSCCCSARC